ncbi:hypothetical protein ACTFIY_009934 [Dictyostelium cf. discoideum]
MKSKRLFFLLCLLLVFIPHYSVSTENEVGLDSDSDSSLNSIETYPFPSKPTTTPTPAIPTTTEPAETTSTIPTIPTATTSEIPTTSTTTSEIPTTTSEIPTTTSEIPTTTSEIPTTSTISTSTSTKPTTSDPTGPTHLGDEEDPYSDNSIFNGTIIVYVIGGACVVFVCIVLYKRFRTGRISTAQNNASYVALQMKD